VRVLVVEDDPLTRELLERGLREELFQVDAVADGIAAEVRATTMRFDAIVLDVVLPGHDGFDVCRRLRTRGVDTPILMLSGRYRIDDRVRGLNAGADDYLAKPFAFAELVARLRAVTRRGRTRTLDAVLTYGPIEFDQHDRVVRVDGTRIELSATELRLLEYLLHHAERQVSREELAQHVWGQAFDGESNVIEVYISHLRKKLLSAGSLVRTRRRLGYMLSKGPV
jgi:DNA-binding response OmpR family regulator